MRKLVESTLVSLDGVIEAPERWATFDDESSQWSMQELDRYDAFVMGRVTYERFRENWGAGGNPYIDRIGAMTKYVASRSLDDVTWNATLLGPDVVAAIQDLKSPRTERRAYRPNRTDLLIVALPHRRPLAPAHRPAQREAGTDASQREVPPGRCIRSLNAGEEL